MLSLDTLLIQYYNYHSGVCYGFQTMRLRESPNTAFTVLFERFKTGTTILTGNIESLNRLTLYNNIIYLNCSSENNNLRQLL